jgi:polar amino acid transport system substrate-binding protein
VTRTGTPTALVLTAALALLISSCSSGSSGSAGTSASSGGSGASIVANPSASSGPASPQPSGATGSSGTAGCSPALLKTQKPGTLTVATDSPAYAPWFANDKPSNGKGFESAVAYAVAKQLGYPPTKVTWVVAPFTSVIAPTPKKYDFDINEVSITTQRAKVVDFSSGYYDVAQAVVALKGNKYASAKTVADLHGAKLGAQQGTTSFTAIEDQIKPGTSPAEYPTNLLAVQALKNRTIDGLVVDLPTGLYITAAQVTGSTIVGQLPVTGKPEQFGLVLTKDSPLTPCVTKAVDALWAGGTLRQLQQRWLTNSAGAPVLR